MTTVGTPDAIYPSPVNYVMNVYGKGQYGGLWVQKAVSFREKASIGGDLTVGDDALVVTNGKTRLYGQAIIEGTGSFLLKGNGAGAGKYLMSDVDGKGTWTTLPAATVTTANNGLTMSGTTTQLGGALAQATTITGSTTNTLTLAVPTTIGTDAAKSDLIVKGNETVGGTLAVTSNTTIGAGVGDNPSPADKPGTGNLRVHGTTTIGTTNAVYDPTKVNYVMNIYGRGKYGGLWVQKAASFKDNVSIGTAASGTTAASGNLTVYNKVGIGRGVDLNSYTLAIKGHTYHDGNLNLLGNESVGGTLAVTGNTTIGKAGVAGTSAGSGLLRVHGAQIIGTNKVQYTGASYISEIHGEGTSGGLWVEKLARFRDKIIIGNDLTTTDDALTIENGKLCLKVMVLEPINI